MFIAATCSFFLSIPDNGGVTFDRDPIGTNKRYPTGTKAKYYCNDGFRLSGSGVATCKSDGSWSLFGSGDTNCKRNVPSIFLYLIYMSEVVYEYFNFWYTKD